MAPIPQTVDVQQQEYLNYSHGFTSPLAAVGTAIGNLGETVAQGATAIKDVYDTKIEQEARDTFMPAVEAERQALSAGQAVAVASNSQFGGAALGQAGAGAIPPDLQSRLNNVSKLQSAVNNGKMLESAYWNRLENEARAMRARYPGFQDLVDKHIAKIVGGNPANQTIQNLFQEQKSAASSEQNLYNHFLKEAIDLGIGGGIVKRVSEGNAPPLTDLMGMVNTRKKEMADITQRRTQMEIDEKQGTLDKHAATQNAAVEVNALITNAWKSGTGKSFDEFQAGVDKNLQTQKVTGSFNPQEMAALTTSFNQLEKELNLQIDNVLTQPIYAKHLDKAAADSIRAVALGKLNTIKQAIFDKDSGTVALLNLDMKMREQRDVRALLNDPGDGPALRLIQAYKEIGGQGFLQSGIFNSSDNLKPWSKFNMNNQILKLAATPGMIQSNNDFDPTTGIEVVNKWQKAGETDPNTYRQLITKHLSVIADPNAPLPVRQNAVNFMFTQGNQNFLKTRTPDGVIHNTYANPESLYLEMSSPQVIAGMQELRKTNPQGWDNYRNWMSHNFQLMSLHAGTAVGNFQAQNQYAPPGSTRIAWDPAINQFKIENPEPIAPPPSGIALEPFGAPLPLTNPIINSDLNAAINNMNKAVTGMSMVIKADGKDPNVVLPQMLAQLGMRTTADPGTRGVQQFSRSIQERAFTNRAFTGAMGTTINSVSTPLGNIQFNKAYEDRLVPLTQGLAELGLNKNEGGYAARYARRENGQTITDRSGRPIISQHAHGNAVDIPVPNNPQLRNRARALAEQNGFKVLEYGGHMHFEIKRDWKKPEESAQ